MRRSRSSSNIPIPTFKRTSSNENLGSSQKCPRTSQQGLTRSNSSNNLFSAKKSLFVGGLKYVHYISLNVELKLSFYFFS